MTSDPAALVAAVERLRAAMEELVFPLDVEGAASARTLQHELRQQLDDYLLPRLRSLDAPLLTVVGGSTGAGKSTLVNSITGEVVSQAGLLRPTTRSSVLVHHEGDAPWFTDDRVLPGLARVTGDPSGATTANDPSSLRLVASSALPAGLALLDAPDIDSVVQANRTLAKQLLSAADLWLFVTTAARYADAVPWGLLREASERGTAIAIVLNRVPPEAMSEVRVHLASMLRDQGHGKAPIFAIPEDDLDGGLIPERHGERLRGWLHSLAGDARARSVVIRRTLSGTLGSLHQRSALLAQAGAEQVVASVALQDAAHRAYRDAAHGVGQGVQDGTLLRGEVLARWHELVGTGDFMRSVEAGISRVRDRLTAMLTGKDLSPEPLGEALQTGAAALVTSHGQVAAQTAARAWRKAPGGPGLLEAHPDLAKASPDLSERVERLVRDWQKEVLDLVREEAGGRRTTARYLSIGVNGLGVLLMIVVFSATALIPTGAEVAVGAGSAVLAQRLLEAVFGDQAVRSMAVKAREALMTRVDELYAQECSRFETALAQDEVSPEAVADLRSAAAAVEAAR